MRSKNNVLQPATKGDSILIKKDGDTILLR